MYVHRNKPSLWQGPVPSVRFATEEIMADADLDILGRDDFLARNQDLRAERAALGMPTTDEEW